MGNAKPAKLIRNKIVPIDNTIFLKIVFVINLFSAVPLTFTAKPSDWLQTVDHGEGHLAVRPLGLFYQTN